MDIYVHTVSACFLFSSFTAYNAMKVVYIAHKVIHNLIYDVAVSHPQNT